MKMGEEVTAEDATRALLYWVRIVANMMEGIIELERRHPGSLKVLSLLGEGPEATRELSPKLLEAFTKMSDEDLGFIMKSLAELVRVGWLRYLSLPLNEKSRMYEKIQDTSKRLSKYLQVE